MSPQMQSALWITGVGSALLFGALACLVGLMYLLTAPWLFPPDAVEETAAPVEAAHDAQHMGETEESGRRTAAVAIAVAVACASLEQVARLGEPVSGWTLLHRGRTLNAPGLRRKARA